MGCRYDRYQEEQAERTKHHAQVKLSHHHESTFSFSCRKSVKRLRQKLRPFWKFEVKSAVFTSDSAGQGTTNGRGGGRTLSRRFTVKGLDSGRRPRAVSNGDIDSLMSPSARSLDLDGDLSAEGEEATEEAAAQGGSRGDTLDSSTSSSSRVTLTDIQDARQFDSSDDEAAAADSNDTEQKGDGQHDGAEDKPPGGATAAAMRADIKMETGFVVQMHVSRYHVNPKTGRRLDLSTALRDWLDERIDEVGLRAGRFVPDYENDHSTVVLDEKSGERKPWEMTVDQAQKTITLGLIAHGFQHSGHSRSPSDFTRQLFEVLRPGGECGIHRPC